MGFVAYHDIVVIRGLAWPSVADAGLFEWRSGDPDETTGLPPLVDLTGFTAVMKIRSSRELVAATLVSLTDAAGITLGGALGTVQVGMSDLQTTALPLGTAFYDLVLFDAGGGPVTFLAGEVHVEPWESRP